MAEKKKKYSWSAKISNEGTLDLELYFPEKGTTKEEKEKILAESLRQSRESMLRKGYLMPDARFMSSSDVAEKYGHTRQYWEKLINEGKIIYKETSAGRITTDLWVQGYLNNRENVDAYVKNCNKAIEVILREKKKMGRIECPNCKKEEFDFAVNTSFVSGICRAGCGFKMHTTIKE